MHSSFLLVPTTHSAGSCYGDREIMETRVVARNVSAEWGEETRAANQGKERAKTDRFRQLPWCVDMQKAQQGNGGMR